MAAMTAQNSVPSVKGAPSQPREAIVHLHQGKPVTDSLTISREFLRPHKNVLQSLDELIADGTISRLEFKPRDYTDERGKKHRTIELTEAGALIAMPFIGGRNSRAGQRRLVDAFMDLRAELTTRQGNEWVGLRRKLATGFQLVCDTLKEVRADQGKATSQHHYTNEAKLINWVLFGHFDAVDRNQMDQADIELMDQVEARDVFLIARGRTYAERKEALPGFLASIRSKPGKIV
jgi:Rha family phage regulatory protein